MSIKSFIKLDGKTPTKLIGAAFWLMLGILALYFINIPYWLEGFIRWGWIALGVIGARIACELVLAAFKTAEAVQEIRQSCIRSESSASVEFDGTDSD
ncbi:MAG: hypothetical protein RBQ83_13100 [Pseudomonas sp.]|nr:hypothetical protein [Pseudomonas sp.]